MTKVNNKTKYKSLLVFIFLLQEKAHIFFSFRFFFFFWLKERLQAPGCMFLYFVVFFFIILFRAVINFCLILKFSKMRYCKMMW